MSSRIYFVLVFFASPPTPRASQNAKFGWPCPCPLFSCYGSIRETPPTPSGYFPFLPSTFAGKIVVVTRNQFVGMHTNILALSFPPAGSLTGTHGTDRGVGSSSWSTHPSFPRNIEQQGGVGLSTVSEQLSLNTSKGECGRSPTRLLR